MHLCTSAIAIASLVAISALPCLAQDVPSLHQNRPLPLVRWQRERERQQCWYPDGVTWAAGDVPCDPSAAVSACCPEDSYCLASGLCARRGALLRASCLEQRWESGACPKFCLDTPAENAPLLSCSNGADETWMCAVGGSCDPGDRLTIGGNDEIRLRHVQLEAALAESPDLAICQRNSTSTPSPGGGRSGESSEDGEGFAYLNVWQVAVLGASAGGMLLLIVVMLSILLWREKKVRLLLEKESVFIGPPPISAHFSPRGFIVERNRA